MAHRSPHGAANRARHANEMGTAAARAGRFDAAAAQYRRALALDPLLAEAHNNLGNIRREQGDLAGAIACYARCLALRPNFAMAHDNLGIALLQSGQAEAAAASHRRAVALDGQNAVSHFNLGNALLQQENDAAAIASFRTALALQPNFGQAHLNLGNALRRLGDLPGAMACYQIAATLRPNDAQAHHNLGNVLLEQDRLEESMACHRRALALRPDYAQAHLNLGNALQFQGRYAEALACYERAAAIRPDDAEAFHKRGQVLLEQNHLAEAEASQARALALRPDHAEAHLLHGNALQLQGRFDLARESFRRAATLRPDYVEARINMGNALQGLGRYAEALASFRDAETIRPEDAAAHVNAAFMLLLMGEFSAGWREYEWRRRLPDMLVPDVAIPPWQGESLAGKSILLQCEQGLGDSLQFVRYAPMVQQRGARVVLACPQVLARLFAGVAGVDQVCVSGDVLPACDFRTPLLSLPWHFDTTLATIPCAVPYLTPLADDAARWAERLRGYPGLKVGLVWAGNPRSDQPHANHVDRRRSMRLADFAPLADVAGVNFFSLQKGAPAAQAKQLPAGMMLTDFMDEVGDFADTAGLVANLDLVIGVDTSVIHLAGALGKPVWVLSRKDGCWRWLLDRDDSPWYPSLRLFRQSAFGDWTAVVAAVTSALAEVARR
jgi:tetratricopeptide (TPR) repeat protein